MKNPMRILMIAFTMPFAMGCGMFTQYATEDCSMLSGRDAMKGMDYRQRQATAELSHEASSS
jgi:hypothetical protein